jgi:hypothetical protein
MWMPGHSELEHMENGAWFPLLDENTGTWHEQGLNARPERERHPTITY